jgi:hypothetical protein
MEERFKKVESEFIQLRKDYQKEKITEREFKDRLKQLRLTDKNGRCWTIGAKTGKWYYYDPAGQGHLHLLRVRKRH